jgi:hypothetical protein
LVLIKFHKIDFSKTTVVFNALAGIIFLLFVFNLVGAMAAGGTNTLSATQLDDGGPRPFHHIKTEFNVDRRAPSPDIYWLFMDGMLGFETVERFFNEPQNELREGLKNRGFIIDEGAKLNAGGTWSAMCALMFPNFYDNYFGELLADTNHLVLSVDRDTAIMPHLNADIGNMHSHIYPYPEFFSALNAAGYTTVQQSTPGHGFTPFASNIFYDIRYDEQTVGTNHGLSPRFPFFVGIENLLEMLIATTPLSIIQSRLRNFNNEIGWRPIPAHSGLVEPLLITHNTHALYHERLLFASLIDSFDIPSPKMVLTTPLFTHRTQWLYFSPNHPEPFNTLHSDLDNPFAGNVYMNAHKYAARVMLNMVDLILAENPDAVIIIQSDHGFRVEYTQNYLRANGMNDHDLFELIHSTINAVRIPESFGGLDEPLAPVNISRELINRFVGQNYKMAKPHVNPIRR